MSLARTLIAVAPLLTVTLAESFTATGATFALVTVMPAEVPVIEAVTVSVAVIVRPAPTLLRVTAKAWTPASPPTYAWFAASTAAPSELVRWTVPV